MIGPAAWANGYKRRRRYTQPCNGLKVVTCLLRTMTTNGLLIMTFTPLQGITPLVLEYLQAMGQAPIQQSVQMQGGA